MLSRLMLTVLALVLTDVPSAYAQAVGADVRVHEVAVAAERPEGAPVYSDVCFSSRWKHPTNANDPHDTFKTAEAFAVTRYLWVYTSDAAFIREAKETATSFQCAVNSMVPDWPEGTRQRGRITDLDGNLVTAPWMRMWKDPAWGCCNSPEWRESYLARAKQAIDAGADLLQMDDPGLNATAVNWGACFCDHCVTGFRDYLATAFSADQLRDLGVDDSSTFDYRVFLRNKNAPVGDGFAKWNGPLKNHFLQYQRESVIQFYSDMRSAIDDYAGRRVAMSTNNFGGRWTFPYDLFDFGMAELPHRDVNPATIYQRLKDARERGKAQVNTLVSEDVAETRRVIATAYACGGHLLVPWDVYLESTPEGSRRYYGKPEDYADLYRFVRANATLFDGYEDAAAVLPGEPDTRYPDAPPIALSDPDGVCAVVRAVPGQADKPVVIHLVDWRETPAPFEVQLNPARFGGGENSVADLLQPGSEPTPVNITQTNGTSTVQIPALSPWAILRLTP